MILSEIFQNSISTVSSSNGNEVGNERQLTNPIDRVEYLFLAICVVANMFINYILVGMW
jgi:hypothetical protein